MWNVSSEADSWYTDIEEPSSGSGMRSKHLYNRTLLVRPQSHGEDVGEDGPYQFWNCDVVILNAAGVEEHGSNVRIGWQNVQTGLKNRQGSWIFAKAVQKGTAWVLDPGAVDPKIKGMVAGLKDEVEALFGDTPPVPADLEQHSPEPF